MTRANEINSCAPIPGVPPGPKQVPREQIFCENVTVKKDLKVEGKFEAMGMAGLEQVTIKGHEFMIAVIVDPGPLVDTTVSINGTVTSIEAGMKLLIALP